MAGFLCLTCCQFGFFCFRLSHSWVYSSLFCLQCKITIFSSVLKLHCRYIVTTRPSETLQHILKCVFVTTHCAGAGSDYCGWPDQCRRFLSVAGLWCSGGIWRSSGPRLLLDTYNVSFLHNWAHQASPASSSTIVTWCKASPGCNRLSALLLSLSEGPSHAKPIILLQYWLLMCSQRCFGAMCIE